MLSDAELDALADRLRQGNALSRADVKKVIIDAYEVRGRAIDDLFEEENVYNDFFVKVRNAVVAYSAAKGNKQTVRAAVESIVSAVETLPGRGRHGG